MGGVARTSASNSALIFGCTPITVSLLSAWLGHERPGWTRWAGAAVSLTGIYLVVGQGARQGTSSLIGDAMIFCAMLCWAGYTVGTKPLLSRYSPLFITGLTMAIGTAVYAPVALLWLRGVDLGRLSTPAWLGIVYSALFSLVAAYVIWYTAVQKLGGGRTSMYSNIVPMVAMAVAAIVLGEPLDGDEAGGRCGDPVRAWRSPGSSARSSRRRPNRRIRSRAAVCSMPRRRHLRRRHRSC